MKDYVAISNSELGSLVKKGDLVQKGLLKGRLEYGTDGDTGEESNLLGFVSIGEDSYLVSIQNKLVLGWEKSNETRI